MNIEMIVKAFTAVYICELGAEVRKVQHLIKGCGPELKEQVMAEVKKVTKDRHADPARIDRFLSRLFDSAQRGEWE